MGISICLSLRLPETEAGLLPYLHFRYEQPEAATLPHWLWNYYGRSHRGNLESDADGNAGLYLSGDKSGPVGANVYRGADRGPSQTSGPGACQTRSGDLGCGARRGTGRSIVFQSRHGSGWLNEHRPVRTQTI